MNITLACLCLAFFATALYAQTCWIDGMKRYKLGQAIKTYGPEAHMAKTGTPSLGGVVVIVMLPLMIALLHLTGLVSGRELLRIWIYPVLVSFIGLLDDLLKLRTKSSEGLKSMQKLLLQILVTVPWAVFSVREGLSLWPGYVVEPAYATILLVFFGVGIQNAVNVTDGLDGLAGGAVIISLLALIFAVDNETIYAVSACSIAVLAAFLWHNSNPAELFMGDVGSHFWAGLIFVLCVESNYFLLVLPVCFIFGIEILSVAVQIAAIRGFKRKVFKMSPLHHHFELEGWKETKIVTRFWIIHLSGMVILMIAIFTLFGEWK